MTYKELLEELQTVSEEQLNQDVAVHLPRGVGWTDDDEYYSVYAICVAVEGECDVLDADHLVLAAGIETY